jgi:hypothetical protein
MTAYLVDNEVRLVDVLGSDVAVISGSAVASSQSGVLFAGLDANGRTAFSRIDGGSIQVRQETPVTVEVGFTVENVTGSCYFMLVDLSNESGSYGHDSSLTGLRLSMIEADAQRTHVFEKWSIRPGIVLSTSITGSTIGWLAPGSLRFVDSFTFCDRARLDKSSLDLTVRSGSLARLTTNYRDNLVDLTSITSLIDVAGRSIGVGPGDLVLGVRKTEDHGGSLSFSYHVQYEERE